MSKQVFTVGQVLTAAEMTTLQANDYNQTVSAKVASYVLVAADAGTRITMSNASATTVTVNTALFTAGDTLTITNIGAGVCTITAGTATVSTGGSLALNQYDSGTLYFTSTGVSIWNGANPGDITSVVAGTGLTGGASSGAATLAIDTAVTVDKTTAQTLTNKTLTSPALTTPTISTLTTNGDLVYGTGSGALSRLGIGSAAQVLTVTAGVPAWSTPAVSSSALVLIKNQVIGSTVSSVTVTNAFSTTYDAYKIVITGTGVGSTAGDAIALQLGSTTTNYDTASFQIDYSGSASFAAGTSGGTSFTRVGATKTTFTQMNLDLLNPFNAAYTFVQGFYDYYTSGGWTTGIQRSTTSFTDFTITPAGGTLTGGTIYVYGYAKS